MRRAELLHIAGTTTTTYAALSNRGLLPFNDRVSGGRWNSYVEEHAIRLALLIHLTKSGMAQPLAASLVRDHFDGLIDFSESLGDGLKPHLIFGGAILQSVDLDLERKVLPIIGARGAIDGVIEQAAEKLSVEDGSVPVSIILGDVTATVRQVLRRTKNEGLNPVEMSQWARFLGVRT